jgi:uroporphyrinogen decarboxylase
METICPDFARVEAALNHTEPDRVPLAEVAVDYAIMSEFLGRPVTDEDVAGQVEFWTQAGYDYSLFTLGMMRPGGVTKDSQISKVMAQTLARDDTDEDAWNLWKKPRIFSEKDFETFPWDRAAQYDFSKFEAAQAYLPDKMKIIAASGKIFTLSWMLMGFENFCVNLKLQPEFTARVIGQVAKIQLDAVRQLARYPRVAAIWAVDDLAFRSGPIVRLPDLRKFIFPYYEELSALCHSHGLYLFFHTDGVIWDLVEDLISLGVDALHPIDPTCMDIDEVKVRLGRRLCLVGNIANDLLAEGTPDQVAALTRQRLRTIAPGGGYCLGAGNSVPAWARIENYRAMLDTVLRQGYYPINVD